MTSEQTLFLALLRDYCSNTHIVSLSEKVNWKTVYSYAEKHSLLGICYIQLKKMLAQGLVITEDDFEAFHKGFFNDVYLALNHRSFIDGILGEFKRKGIAHILFKGWIIKNSWPVPELRTMGDIDILIHTEDRASTDAIMKDLGYERFIDNHAVWTYFQKDSIIELHDHMFYEHLINEVDYREYFDHAWEYANPELDESYHFLYLITHMAKHTINNGMGFRAYLDLVFFCRSVRERLHWEWICEELEKLKLLAFAKTCFAFCQEWFGYESPIPVGELDPAFFIFVTEKLLDDGVFGLENTQNEAANSAKEIAYSRVPYFLGAITVTIKRLFPSYEDMQLIPWYSFVDGRPWLLPVAWVYRWGYCLIHKRQQGGNILTEPFAKKTTIKKRQQLIKDWGL